MQDAFIHHEKANIDQMYLKRVYLKIKSIVKKGLLSCIGRIG